MHKLEITPTITIPAHLIGQVQSKLAYVDEAITSARITESGDKISLELNGSLDATRTASVEEKVQRVVSEMAKGAVQPRVDILEDLLDRPVPFAADPMDELLARREVSEEATGIFTFGPLFTRLVEYFESLFLDLAASFDAQPYRFPTLMSARLLDSVDYFRAFPHSLTFAAHLREDLDVINRFAESAVYEEDGLNAPEDAFSKIQALLSPAVCYHLYFSLADQTLPAGRLVATAVGNCFRYESTNLITLERLWNFTMREVIFIGSKDFILESRELSRQHMSKVFEELGFAYRVETANDPFFVGEFRKQAAFQNAFQLKYEIRARLPFKDGTLAVGSYNYHQDFFGRHLNVSLPDGSPIHTGCTAFGLERIVYAFLSQFGLDPVNWPAPVREALS